MAGRRHAAALTLTSALLACWGAKLKPALAQDAEGEMFSRLARRVQARSALGVAGLLVMGFAGQF